MRRSIIAGNWKMNKSNSDAKTFCQELVACKLDANVDIVLCPPFTALSLVNDIIKESPCKLGAQNLYNEPAGAFTGEVSGEMLRSSGCDYVILGHSERRTYFNETNIIINQKIHAAYRDGLIPIYCVGETLEERESNVTFDVIQKQLDEGLHNLETLLCQQGKELIIAYEPVWAIGTGKVASPDQAQDVHHFIRSQLSKLFGQEKADEIRIQYGGSVKPNNVVSLMSQVDIDGALVGGACLEVDMFQDIINWNH